MKISVVYFSRTGTTKTIAKELAEKLGCNLVELQDDVKWSGIIGWFRGGFYAAKDKPVNIKFNRDCLDSEKFIVLSPLWAGGPAPAARTFIRQVANKKVSLLLTNDGSNIGNAFKKVDVMFPDIRKKYGITKKLNNKDVVIKQIVADEK